MKVYHIDRDPNKTLTEQKKELEKQYKDFLYLHSDGQKIHFIAEEEQK
jgi:hypothetical protein